MSDSEDSDSFLSADEGEANAGSESSDITLSSDSEQEGGGRAGAGDPSSSDISLSSDEDGDDSANPPADAAVRKAGSVKTAIEDGKARKSAVQVSVSSAKTTKSVCIDEHGELNVNAKPGQHICKPELSPSDAASSTLLDAKEPCAEQGSKNKGTSSNPPVLLGTSQAAPKTSTSELPASSGTSTKPLKESPLPQPHQTQSARTRSQAACETEGPVTAPTSAVTATADGWGEPEDEITLPDDPAAAQPGTGEEQAGWGWTDDPLKSAASVQKVEPASTGSRDQTRSPSEPKALSTEPSTRSTSEEPSVPTSGAENAAPSEPTKPPPEPPAPPSEPALRPSEPASAASEPFSAASAASEPAASRRRPERRERRGPMKLGAKKLGSKLTSAPPPQPGGDARGGGGESQTAGGGHPAEERKSDRQEEQDGWGGWESWGSSLLSSAADVTRTVLETVETGLGAPEPEHLARQEREQRSGGEGEQRSSGGGQREAAAEEVAADPPPPADPSPGLGSWLGGVSRVLGQTSSLVVTTGLDTLEAIGKKTMTVLQEDQLGIHGTISQLGGQRTSLAQALREARQGRGHAPPSPLESSTGDRPPTFSQLFDQCEGTVHLEALEMLSARCRSRVAAARGRLDEPAGILLHMVEEVCSPEELPDVEVADFQTELPALVARLSVPVKPTRLVIAHSSAAQWLAGRPHPAPAPHAVLSRSVRCSAEMGAGLAELLHKLAELRLAGAGAAADPVAAGRQLAALAALVAAEGGRLAAGFAETLSGVAGEPAAAATTDIYLEALPARCHGLCPASSQQFLLAVSTSAVSAASRTASYSLLKLLLTAVLLTGVEARRSRRPDYCDPQSRRSSFLWRIDTKPPSYFFGTIHVPYNRVWEHIPENVKRAFRLADSVFFELDLTDEPTVSALTKCQLLPRGGRLEQLLPRDIYRRLQKHLDYVRNMMPLWMTADQRGRGLYADYLFNAITGNWQQKRPIWVMLMVNTLTESDVRARGVPVLDLHLALEAKKTKRTGAVERVEEQCLPLNGLNISQVVFALNQTLNQHESIRAGEETPSYTTDDLIRHYNCGDLDEVIFRRDSSQIPPSVFQVPPLQSAAAAASATQRITAHSIDRYFRDELIYKRNRRMGERIVELLWARPNESYFFAFGAGHFLGNYTVLDVLRQAGYKVTKVGPRERIRRFNRGRRPGSGGGGGGGRRPPSSSRRYGGSGAAARRAGAAGGGRRASRQRATTLSDNFSDLWVRLDDTQRSEPTSGVSRSDEETVLVPLGSPPDAAARSAAELSRCSASLLTALLLMVMALSPPRT